MSFLHGNLKAQKIIFDLKPRPLLARLRYLKTEVKNCHELCKSEFVDVPVQTEVEVPIKLCYIL